MNEYEVFKSGPRKGQPKTLTDRVVIFLFPRPVKVEMPRKLLASPGKLC